jgi:membrane-associated phospholipid phosphatase
MLGKDEIHPGGVRASIADWLTAYRLAVGLGAAFLALTVAVQIGATAPLDRLLEQHTGTLASGNWSLLALAADPFVVTVVFAAALLAMWRRSATVHPLAWAAAFLFGQLVEMALKWHVGQIPFNEPERVLGVWMLAGSYPSGHAMRAVLLAGVASAVAPRWRWLWIAYAAGMSAWVLVSGMHLSTDTLGGVLLGAMLVAAVNRWSAIHSSSVATQTRRPKVDVIVEGRRSLRKPTAVRGTTGPGGSWNADRAATDSGE